MLDAQPLIAMHSVDRCRTPQLARSEGALRLALKRRGDDTVIDRLFQKGCLRARFPSVRAKACETVLLNTAGGLTGGDALSLDVSWGAATEGTVTTQAAEKIYRSIEGTAQIRTTLEIGPGASGAWLPQETIFFDRAALDRDIAIRLAPDARFLGLEAVILGRSAMGEAVHNGALRDAWRIWRGDALIYADALTWHAAIAAMLQSPAIAPGMIAFATLLWVHPNAIAGRDRLRACAGNFACSAVSSWNGILAIRLAAPDGARLRRDIIAALHSLEPERPLPSLWRS